MAYWGSAVLCHPPIEHLKIRGTRRALLNAGSYSWSSLPPSLWLWPPYKRTHCTNTDKVCVKSAHRVFLSTESRLYSRCSRGCLCMAQRSSHFAFIPFCLFIAPLQTFLSLVYQLFKPLSIWQCGSSLPLSLHILSPQNTSPLIQNI